MQLFYPFICIFHLEDQLYKKRKRLHATCLINEILLDVICKPLAHFFSHLRFIPTPSLIISLLLRSDFYLFTSLSLSRLMKILNLRQVHWFKPPLGSQAYLPKLNKIVMHITQRLMW